MLPPTPPINNMAEIAQRCSTLRFLTAKISAGHGDFITKTFLREKDLCVSSSLQVLDDATVLVSAATIRIEPVCAATLEEQPNGYPTPASQKPNLFTTQQRGGFGGSKQGQRSHADHTHLRDIALGVLQRTHTAEELDKVVAVGASAPQGRSGSHPVAASVSRTPALSWKRWKAAEPGKTAFVGFSREKIQYAFVPCVTYAHAVNETTCARTFPGLAKVHVVMVCPSAPGASCSLSECMNDCTVWRVPVESH